MKQIQFFSKTSFGCYCTLSIRNGIYSTVCSAATDGELLYSHEWIKSATARDWLRGARFIAMVLKKCHECATAHMHHSKISHHGIHRCEHIIISSLNRTFSSSLEWFIGDEVVAGRCWLPQMSSFALELLQDLLMHCSLFIRYWLFHRGGGGGVLVFLPYHPIRVTYY